MLPDVNDQFTISYKQTDGSMLDPDLRGLLLSSGIHLIPIDHTPEGSTYPILRVTKKGLSLEDQGTSLFFHPNMAIVRMINILKGVQDRFLHATNLQAGDSFLDATMGLASDTLIASWAVGDYGKVVALEHSPLIHVLVRDGLDRLKRMRLEIQQNQSKKQAWAELIKASSKIETYCADHYEFLNQLPEKSIDVIYFDPMFRITSEKSSGIKPIKTWSNPEPISEKTIQQACRVAKKRIVLKERRTSNEFDRLGFKILAPSKYSTVNFGIIDIIQARGIQP